MFNKSWVKLAKKGAQWSVQHCTICKTGPNHSCTNLFQAGGPPVIELGGGHDHLEGEIVVGQRRPEESVDHLSGFYSVDFDDDFTTGDAQTRKPRKPEVVSTLEKAPKKLSVHVSGLSGGIADTRELAQLFKDGRMDGDKHKAYISKPDEQAPAGKICFILCHCSCSLT